MQDITYVPQKPRILRNITDNSESQKKRKNLFPVEPKIVRKSVVGGGVRIGTVMKKHDSLELHDNTKQRKAKYWDTSCHESKPSLPRLS